MFSFLFNKEVILSISFTLLGIFSCIIPHIMMQTESVGKDPKGKHFFKKPSFLSFLQFLGTSFVIIMFFAKTYTYKYEAIGSISTQQKFWSFILKVFIISIFEILSTMLMFVSLVYMPLSTWQMLRGTVKIFDCVLMRLFYKKRISVYETFGIVIEFIGMVAISVEFMINSNQVSTDIAISYIFAILAQFFQSCKSFLEINYLKDPNESPEMIIGVEGIISSLISLIILLPIFNLYGGKCFKESISDTKEMLLNNGVLLTLTLLYVIIVAAYLSLSICLIDLRSKYKSIMGIVRSVIILILSPIMNAFNKNLGQPFSLMSIMFLCGSALVLIGSLIYDSVIRIPWLDYPPDSDSGYAEFRSSIEDDSSLVSQN